MLPMTPLFSDLRGVTVRNTFLEFEDVGGDPLALSGFLRQSSEPAKPFKRQVSEQTSTESGATLDESVIEPEEGHSQLTSDRFQSYAQDMMGTAFQAAHPATAVTFAQFPMYPQVPQGQLAAPRFCPNCGMETEPTHRFCPYCCYALQASCMGSGPAGGASPGVAALEQCSFPVNGVSGQGAASSTPNLLTYLRRFRYVQACDADIEFARAQYLNITQRTQGP